MSWLGAWCRIARLALLASLAAPAVHADDVSRERFHSPRLGREVAYTVVVPELQGREPGELPLIYLLHGAGGTESDWLRDGQLAPALAQPMRDGLMRASIIVMPSLGPHTWWVDGAVDAAATALVDELMPHVDARLQRTGLPRRVAIAGVSMGGFGALHLALLHPQRFCAAALISPAAYEPFPPPHSAARSSAQFARDGGFDPGLWTAANHPVRLVAYRESPDKVPMWIVAGDDDELGIAVVAVRLHERLRAIQPARTELRIIDGGHDWPTFEAALPGALKFIDQRCR